MLLKRFVVRKNVDPNYLWLIVFADMSTNLMLFFLMLFATTRMSGAEQKRTMEMMGNLGGDKHAIVDRVERKRREEKAISHLKDMVASGKLKHYAKIEANEKYIKLTLDLPVFFQSGRAELNSGPQEALEAMAEPLKEFPNNIIVEGHTDNIPLGGGTYPSNWELSVARAVSVIDFFIAKGLDPDRLVAGGYGEHHPAYPNDTAENRARNRRIEITIIRELEAAKS